MTMMTNGCFDDADHDDGDHRRLVIMMIMMMMIMMTMMFTAGWMEAGNCRDLLLDKLQQLQPVFPAQIICFSFTNTPQPFIHKLRILLQNSSSIFTFRPSVRCPCVLKRHTPPYLHYMTF